MKMHTKTCLKEECPLTKFIQNKGNYNMVQQMKNSKNIKIYF